MSRRIAEPARTGPHLAAGRPGAFLTEGRGGQVRIHFLDGRNHLVGRSSECQIRLRRPAISRRHAVIRDRGPGARVRYEIFDCASTNGVRVNGQLVRASLLVDGDRIDIGDAVLSFHISRSVADPETGME